MIAVLTVGDGRARVGQLTSTCSASCRLRVVFAPLGVPLSLARRRALLAIAERHDLAVIEDDYDSEFRFGDRPVETMHALDTSGRVIYVGSFSKTLLPTLRLGIGMRSSCARSVRSCAMHWSCGRRQTGCTSPRWRALRMPRK